VPIEIALRQSGDDGRPLVCAAPDGPAARSFTAIAEAVARTLGESPPKPAPRIVVED